MQAHQTETLPQKKPRYIENDSVFVTVRGSKLLAVGVRHPRMASFFRTFSPFIVSKTYKEPIYWVLKIDFTLLLTEIYLFFLLI